MVCHFVHAVVRHVLHLHAVLGAGLHIHIVDAHAIAYDQLEVGQGLHHLAGDRRVLVEEDLAVGTALDDVVLGDALLQAKGNARSIEDGLLGIDVGVIVVSDDDLHDVRAPSNIYGN